MKIHFFKAEGVLPLLLELEGKVFVPTSRPSEIFVSHAIFVPNTYGKTRLEEYFLQNSPYNLLGNIHFFEWVRNLEYLLENPETLFSKEILSLFLGEFLEEKTSKVTEKDKNLFLEGEYYQDLFIEYEMFVPEIFHGISSAVPKDKQDIFFKNPKAKHHLTLYKEFWEWFKIRLRSFVGEIPNRFLYPDTPLLNHSLRGVKQFHLFLPREIYPSQLLLLKRILEERELHVYVQDSSLFHKLPKGLYEKKEVLAFWQKHCDNLGIEYKETLLKDKSIPFFPKSHIFFIKDNELEKKTLVSDTLEFLEKEEKLPLSYYNILFSFGESATNWWEEIFDPFVKDLPTHFLPYKKKVSRDSISYTLRRVFTFFHSEKSKEDFLDLLSLPLIKECWDITEEDIKELDYFFKDHMAFGENPLYHKENQLSYHLSLYSYRDFLDIPKSYYLREISHSPLKLCFLIFEHIVNSPLNNSHLPLLEEDIEKILDFLEQIIPSHFWDESSKPKVRKDMLQIRYNYLSLQTLYPYFKSLNKDILNHLLSYDKEGDKIKENLSRTKKRGIMGGNVDSFMPFPTTYLRVVDFCESFSSISSYPFHKESYLRGQNSLQEIHFIKNAWCSFFELLGEAKEITLSYGEKDAQTKEEQRPYFLYSVWENLGWLSPIKEKEVTLTLLKPLYNNEEGEDIKQNLFSRKESQLSVKKIARFLEFPLLERIERFLGKGEFLDRRSSFKKIPYFFGGTSTQSQKLWEKIFYYSYDNPELLKKMPSLTDFIGGAEGIAKNSALSYKKFKFMQQEIFTLIEKLEEKREELGSYYHTISVGSYLPKEDKQHLILPSLSMGGVRITMELFHLYIKEDETQNIITLPISSNIEKGGAPFPPLKTTLSLLYLGLLLGKPSFSLQFFFPKDNNYKKSAYTYKRENVYDYFLTILEKRQEWSSFPFSFEDVKKLTQERKKKKKEGSFLLEDLSSLMKGLNDSHLSSLFLSKEEEDVSVFEEEMKFLYDFLFSAWNKKD